MFKGVYSCRHCHKPIELKDIPGGTFISKRGMTICKGCKGEYSANWQMEVKASRYPEKYKDCNECYKIFAKKVWSKIRTFCPHCGSKDIDNYSEDL